MARNKNNYNPEFLEPSKKRKDSKLNNQYFDYKSYELADRYKKFCLNNPDNNAERHERWQQRNKEHLKEYMRAYRLKRKLEKKEGN